MRQSPATSSVVSARSAQHSAVAAGTPATGAGAVGSFGLELRKLGSPPRLHPFPTLSIELYKTADPWVEMMRR